MKFFINIKKQAKEQNIESMAAQILQQIPTSFSIPNIDLTQDVLRNTVDDIAKVFFDSCESRDGVYPENFILYLSLTDEVKRVTQTKDNNQTEDDDDNDQSRNLCAVGRP